MHIKQINPKKQRTNGHINNTTLIARMARMARLRAYFRQLARICEPE